MATLNAFKQLGKSIVADVLDTKASIAESIARAKRERQVISDFKAALREHPVELAKALHEATKPKRASRKAAE